MAGELNLYSEEWGHEDNPKELAGRGGVLSAVADDWYRAGHLHPADERACGGHHGSGAVPSV